MPPAQRESCDMATIGFIGASGLMGHGMAKNLLAKGHGLGLTVHRNRERVADLLAAGAVERKNPAERSPAPGSASPPAPPRAPSSARLPPSSPAPARSSFSASPARRRSSPRS